MEQVRRPRDPINPRYTGHQVWNKQRKDEVLIDVEDVALGHTTKLRWNDTGKWLWSEKIVQPPIIDRDIFDQVQAMVGGRATKPAAHKPHRGSTLTRCAACVWSAGCASGGCKATGSTAHLTTGAASPPSTRSPTACSTR